MTPLYKMFFILSFALFYAGVLHARPGFGDSSPAKYFKKTRQKNSKDNSSPSSSKESSPRSHSKESSPRASESAKRTNLSPLRLFNAIKKSRSKEDVLGGRPSSSAALTTSASLEEIPVYTQAGLEPAHRTSGSENLKKSRSSTTLNRIRPMREVPSVNIISDLIFTRGDPADRVVATSLGTATGSPPHVEKTPRCVGVPAFPLALQRPPLHVFTPSHERGYLAYDHIKDFHKIKDADCIKFNSPGALDLNDEVVQNIFSACIMEFDKIKAVEFGLAASLSDESFLCLISFENISQLNFYKGAMSLNTLRVICSHLPLLSHLNLREMEAPELLSDFQKHYVVLLDALGLLRKLEEVDISDLRGLERFVPTCTQNPALLKAVNKNLRVLVSYARLQRFFAEGWPLDQETVFLLFLSKTCKSLGVGPVYMHSDFFKKYKLTGPFCCFSLVSPIDENGYTWGSQDQLIDLKSALPKLKLLRLRDIGGLSAETIELLKKRGLDLSLSNQDDLNYIDPYATWGYDGQAFDL